VKKFAPLHCAESLCENIVEEQSRSLCKKLTQKKLVKKKFVSLSCVESLCENIVQEQSRSLCKKLTQKKLVKKKKFVPCLVWRTCATTCVLNSSDKKDMEKVIAQRNDKQKKNIENMCC